jgi:hypothetical protein
VTPIRSSRGQDTFDSEPTRDPALAAELRRRDAIESNADKLRAVIVAAARERLVQLDGGDAWWAWTARWSRAAIPIACAAGLVGAALTALLSLPTEEQTALRAPVVAFATIASPAVTGTQLMDSLVGPATHDWVLNGAVAR